MREIKFRAWNPEIQEMHFSSNETLFDKREFYPWGFEIGNSGYPESGWMFMQFTGLKDKNGQEIYEGDQLFICAGYSSVVEFRDGAFWSVYSHPEDGETMLLYEAIGNDTEIVGNIHQNNDRL